MTAEIIKTESGFNIVLPPEFLLKPGSYEIESVGGDHFYLRRRKEGMFMTEAEHAHKPDHVSDMEVPPDYLPEPVEPFNF